MAEIEGLLIRRRSCGKDAVVGAGVRLLVGILQRVVGGLQVVQGGFGAGVATNAAARVLSRPRVSRNCF